LDRVEFVSTSAAGTQKLRGRAEDSSAIITTHAEASDFVHEGRLFTAIAAPFVEEKEIKELS
jgi:hypothetical protein